MHHWARIQPGNRKNRLPKRRLKAFKAIGLWSDMDQKTDGQPMDNRLTTDGQRKPGRFPGNDGQPIDTGQDGQPGRMED